jgi:putative acetyltransferase
VRVSLESPDQPDVVALIAELDAYQDSLYPPEARYALDLVSLLQPNVVFAVARAADRAAIGCGAIVLGERYGEVKRLYVRPAARGTGVASTIIRTLESAVHARGCQLLMLETGPSQPEALAFYGKHGYTRCEAFGAYPEHPLSVFMSKRLVAAPAAARAGA